MTQSILIKNWQQFKSRTANTFKIDTRKKIQHHGRGQTCVNKNLHIHQAADMLVMKY